MPLAAQKRELPWADHSVFPGSWYAGCGFVTTLVVFTLAALAEIAGCCAFWAWSRLDHSAWWLIPGLAALAVFALLLTFADTAFAGRAYAAYGGIYVATSLGWLRVVEGAVPNRWDLLGGFIVLAGTALILCSPRSA